MQLFLSIVDQKALHCSKKPSKHRFCIVFFVCLFLFHFPCFFSSSLLFFTCNLAATRLFVILLILIVFRLELRPVNVVIQALLNQQTPPIMNTSIHHLHTK
jgi:hypothetical protein